MRHRTNLIFYVILAAILVVAGMQAFTATPEKINQDLGISPTAQATVSASLTP